MRTCVSTHVPHDLEYSAYTRIHGGLEYLAYSTLPSAGVLGMGKRQIRESSP
jgi:hypothetical protein